MPNLADLLALSANNRTKLALLSEESSAILFTAVGESVERLWTWEGTGEHGGLSDEEREQVLAIMAKAEEELMSNLLVGTVFYHACSVPPDGSLACDGQVYDRVDYPLLYERLDSYFIVDEDTFRVPDLEGRFVLGESEDFTTGDADGETEHTLTNDEIPAHSHTYGKPDFGISVVGPGEVPAAQVDLIPDVTGNTGGGEAHNNMPPYLVLRSAIWAA